MSRADEFIELYKELESAAVHSYGYPADGRAVSRLENRKEFSKISTELGYCREVRNLLQHKPKVKDRFMVEPSEEMVQLLRDTLEKVQNPVRCHDIAIPFEKMYWKTMDDPVLPSIKGLKDGAFTHIPILDNRRVVGIFSVNALFSYLLAHGLEGLTNQTRFRDMSDCIGLDSHPSEIFVFERNNATVNEAEVHFEEALRKGRRVGMVFLTENGRSTDKLLGILTAWDMVGN